jgi:hypothetical protein
MQQKPLFTKKFAVVKNGGVSKMGGGPMPVRIAGRSRFCSIEATDYISAKCHLAFVFSLKKLTFGIKKYWEWRSRM